MKEIAPYGPLASNCTSWIGNFIFKICRLITIVFFHTLRSQNVNLINNLEFLTQQKSQQDSKIGTFLVHPSQKIKSFNLSPKTVPSPIYPQKKGWNHHHPPKPHIRPPRKSRNHIHCYPPTALRIKDLSPCCDLR